MTWNQNYYPLGNVFLSALVAAIPVAVLLISLAFFEVKAHIAALLGLGTAILIALFVYGMPFQLAAGAAVNGAAYGLFPIGWIVLGAIFVFDITVFTGKFEIVKHTIAGLSSDRRIQVILIAFSFGAFIEGSSGFGTPIAICAAMMIGLGFKPLQAAGLCLIGNTAPVAFGALGSPIIALASVTGLNINQLSSMVGRQLPFFSIIVPFYLIWVLAGRKSMLEVWPACLTAGSTFAIVQFLVSNLHGPWLVDIIASLVSIASVVGLLRFWQPKSTWRFEDDEVLQDEREVAEVSNARNREVAISSGAGVGKAEGPVGFHRSGQSNDMEDAINPAATGTNLTPVKYGNRDIWLAWLPWIILSVVVFFWGIPEVKNCLNNVGSPVVTANCTIKPPGVVSSIGQVNLEIPGLHKSVIKQTPVVAKPTPEDAIFTFNWLSATGTGLLLAGFISGLILGLKPLQIVRLFGKTLWRVRFSLLTIAAMLALGYTSRYAGLDSTMGLALASTGAIFAFFSPLLGWLGVALTGSDTSSNVLFGNLQKIAAQQIGLSPILTASANSSGGVMGKMIDAQSIVVAGVATGQQGGEGKILKYVFKHSLILAILVGILVFLQAYVFPWMIAG